MTEPYLILHKVRGEPAFDVAVQLRCPICDNTNTERRIENASSCHECKGVGVWWIIPTSGHRAYPYWSDRLDQGFSVEDIVREIFIPDNVPDHYSCNSTPKPKPPSRVTPPTTDDFLI